MSVGKPNSLLLGATRRLAQAAVPSDLWPMVDDELQEELAERRASGGAGWRTSVWGARQYLSLALRLAVEGVRSGVAERKSAPPSFAGLSWDLRHAFRALRTRPAAAFTVIATVAISVGATTAVYSVVDGVLLRPLPYPESDRLARIWQTRPGWRDSERATLRALADRINPQAPDYYEWQETETGFESLGAYVDASFVLFDSDGATVVKGQEADAGLFKTLGVQPALGRTTLPGDDLPGAPRVVVLSQAFWNEHLGASTQVLGSELILDGEQHTVVGVMPSAFRAPTGDFSEANLPGGAPLMWTPLTEEARVGDKNVSVIGRLARGTPLDVAGRQLANVDRTLREGNSQLTSSGIRVESLLQSVVGDVRPTLWFLLGAVALVLLVATVNISNILIAMGLNRRRELAVRSALGAGQGRLVRGLFVESGILAILGGIGGVFLAWITLPVLLLILPSSLPRYEMVRMSPGVMFWGLMITGVTGVLVGTLPAVLAARADPQDALRSSARALTSSRGAARIRSGLVVIEVSVAVVLMVGAGLLASSYLRLWSVDRGFATEGLVAMWVNPDPATHRTDADYDRFSETLRRRLEEIPGVQASAANNVPLSGLTSGTFFRVDRGSEASDTVAALLSVGLDNYLTVVGIPLLAGRSFTRADTRESPRVAIVNETMANTVWPGRSVVGQRLWTPDDGASAEIVGVAADVRHGGLANEVEPQIYLPASQSRRDTNEWVLRIQGDIATALRQSREAVAQVSSSTPVSRTLVLEETISRTVEIPRFRTYFTVGLAGLAGFLALLGVYGALAFAVAQRTKEIGIRMALGARTERVTRSVVGSGLKLAATGAGIGCLVAWNSAEALSAFLFQVAPSHPSTYVGVVLVVLGISALASYIPARRAAAVDPAGVLNHD